MSRASLQHLSKTGTMSFLAQKIEEKNRMKDSVTTHRTGLPPHILRFFEARPQPYHFGVLKNKKPLLPYSGIAQYIDQFANPDDPEYQPPAPTTRPEEPRIFANPELPIQSRVDLPSRIEAKIIKRKEKDEQNKIDIEQALQAWDPNKDPNIEGDALKTIFVGNLSEDVTERKLKREFEEFGPIHRIRMVNDKISGKPKGYAFIEYEHKSDMKDAYKGGDGRKIEGKRCIVDVERGRTVPTWKPHRLGGGKSNASRSARLPKSQKRQLIIKIIQKALGKQGDMLAPPREDDHQPLYRSSNAGGREREPAGIGGYDRERRRDGDRGRDTAMDRDSYRDRDRDRESYRDRDRRRDVDKRRRGDDGFHYDRDRERGGGRDRDRGGDRHYSSSHRPGRDHGRDVHRSERDGPEYSRKRDRYHDDKPSAMPLYQSTGDYVTTDVPAMMVVNDGGTDEPEEGEFIAGEEERMAKRMKE